MRTPFVALGLLAASTMTDMAAFTKTNSFGAMLKRGDTILKRRGYTPDTSYGGKGDTFAEACRANSVECPSTLLPRLERRFSTSQAFEETGWALTDHCRNAAPMDLAIQVRLDTIALPTARVILLS